ncbi:MAG: type II toxin-antitoxin system HicB family antitoxin [Caldilineaceae bacterium]|nr:type II toxin-antitoxin system HicB family antitoxin [Caldilineaceae bacterium]
MNGSFEKSVLGSWWAATVVKYKEYTACNGYSEDDGCFVGHIAGISDIVGFHGESVAELRAAFEEAVDDYLETCKKLDRTPEKPFSGMVNC